MLGPKNFSIFLLTALLLAACGPLAVITPTAAPTAAQTAAPSPTSRPSPTPPPTSTAAPAAQNGPPHPKSAFWLANPQDGRLLVIDPADNSVAVIVPTALRPERVVVGAGFAWALDSSSSTLLQVDLQTYTPIRELRFPKQQLNALAVGAGSVWLGVTERSVPQVLRPKEEFIPSGGVLRIDPASGETKGYAKSSPVTDLFVSQSAVYALARGQVDTPLLRIDPVSLHVDNVRLSGTSDWLLEDAVAAGTSGLWLFSQGFGKLYHTTLDGRVSQQFFLGQHSPPGPAALLETNGAIWLAVPWGRILRIDPANGSVAAEIELDAPATMLFENSGAVWAVSPAGAAAYRIDSSSSSISASVALGSRVLPLALPSPTAVRRATQPCEDGPLSRLALGMRATTPLQPALPVRLHKETGKDSEISGYIQPGQRVEIVEGPQCMDGWVWWRVNNLTNNASGWAAEGDASEYWLIPVQ